MCNLYIAEHNSYIAEHNLYNSTTHKHLFNATYQYLNCHSIVICLIKLDSLVKNMYICNYNEVFFELATYLIIRTHSSWVVGGVITTNTLYPSKAETRDITMKRYK